MKALTLNTAVERFDVKDWAMPKISDAEPRYLILRERLENDIAKGVYPVGSIFPTEEQLGIRYQIGIPPHFATRLQARDWGFSFNALVQFKPKKVISP